MRVVLQEESSRRIDNFFPEDGDLWPCDDIDAATQEISAAEARVAELEAQLAGLQAR